MLLSYLGYLACYNLFRTLASVFYKAISQQLVGREQSFFLSFLSTAVIISLKPVGSVPLARRLVNALTRPSNISSAISLITLQGILSGPVAFPFSSLFITSSTSSFNIVCGISILRSGLGFAYYSLARLPWSPAMSLRSACPTLGKNLSASIQAFPLSSLCKGLLSSSLRRRGGIYTAYEAPPTRLLHFAIFYSPLLWGRLGSVVTSSRKRL